MEGKGAAAVKAIYDPMPEASQVVELQQSARQNGGTANGAAPPKEYQSGGVVHKEHSHMTNERLLAAGGTVAGAAFLGGALGGAIGVVAGAGAGLVVAIFSSKSKLKEGARRS